MARKQEVAHLVIESALTRTDVCEDIDALDDVLGGGGSAEAVAIAFFKSENSPLPIEDAAERDLLGQLVLINYRAPGSANFTHSYIYEAILSPPRMPGSDRLGLLNNFICSDGQFICNVSGRQFKVLGIYYCQQNGRTHVCAHACLRMGLNTMVGTAGITNKWINEFLSVAPPVGGLSLEALTKVIAHHGTNAVVTNCTGMDAPTYLSVLASIVESGLLALLVFTTGHASDANQLIEHVVTIFGHTHNSDEWHPQALPAYSGPSSAQFYAGSSWVDHFLIHDDNFGPYYTLSSRAFEADEKVKARWIIGLYPCPILIQPNFAESLSAAVLANLLPGLASLAIGRWFEYITRTQHKFILRTILIERATYLRHIQEIESHDKTRANARELEPLNELPERFWMVEFTLPALYTGNRSKLGEVLIDTTKEPDPNSVRDLLLGLRLPALWLLKGMSGQLNAQAAGIQAHVPIFRGRAHDHIW